MRAFGSSASVLWCAGVDVRVGDIAGRGKGRAELDRLPELFPQFASLLAGMAEGDHALVRVPDTLSRVGAGLVYALYRCFSRIRIVKPPACSPCYLPSKFVLCEHSLGPCHVLAKHLLRAASLATPSSDNLLPERPVDENNPESQQQRCTTPQGEEQQRDTSCGTEGEHGSRDQPPPEREVLSLVPMSRMLLDPRFYPALVHSTERLLQRQVAAAADATRATAAFRLAADGRAA